MNKCTIKSVLVGAICGLTLASLGGCASKVASLAPVDQTATAEGNATTPATTDKSTAGATATATPKENAMAKNTSDGAGSSEPLYTPPPTEGAMMAASDHGKAGGLQSIYFDFDQTTLRPDQMERLMANAKYLKNNPGELVQIEGNSDARGSNIYNLALGEKRATIAKKLLVNLGVKAEQLSTLSYGEERPAVQGENETAWAQNRRDDFAIVR